jgi:BASS family bile acid:Na+ symporter
MNLLVPAIVAMLMVSIGMSLSLRDLVARWSQLTPSNWLRLLFATFVAPPAILLCAARFIPLTLSELAGLFMVSVAPGAPLLTRNMARRGFDMKVAAAYQIWGAVLTPLVLPLIVAVVGQFYNRQVWISPVLLLREIALKQFVPLLIGMACLRFLPAFSQKARSILNLLGNALLTLVIVLMVIKLGPFLAQITLWLFVAALLLAVGSMAAMTLIGEKNSYAVKTLALSNANRHVGLAMLLSGQYLGNSKPLVAIACYAILASILILSYARFFGRKDEPHYQARAA